MRNSHVESARGISILIIIVLILALVYFMYPKDDTTTNQVITTTPKTNSVPKVTNNNSAPAVAVAPSITILTPNGNEKLVRNTEQTVTWTYQGLNDYDSIVVGFRTSDESVCWAGKTNASKRSYSFTPSQVVCGGSLTSLKSGGEYKAQLIVERFNTGQGVADTSDGYFTVVAK